MGVFTEMDPSKLPIAHPGKLYNGVRATVRLAKSHWHTGPLTFCVPSSLHTPLLYF